MRNIESIVCYSRESIKRWYKIISEALPRPSFKKRKAVAVDETKIKLSGRIVYLWAARDIKSGEIIAIRAIIELYRRDEPVGTLIRNKMIKGEDWKEYNMMSVTEYIEFIRGVGRMIQTSIRIMNLSLCKTKSFRDNLKQILNTICKMMEINELDLII